MRKKDLMSIENRPLVIEHMLTRVWGLDEYGFKIRYWIESHRWYGGVNLIANARRLVDEAQAEVAKRGTWFDQYTLGNELFALLPAANSLEVVDEHGDGAVFHRDWP